MQENGRSRIVCESNPLGNRDGSKGAWWTAGRTWPNLPKVAAED
jgi:hypothetical protein